MVTYQTYDSMTSQGHVVGLRAKGQARKDTSGFVVD